MWVLGNVSNKLHAAMMVCVACILSRAASLHTRHLGIKHKSACQPQVRNPAEGASKQMVTPRPYMSPGRSCPLVTPRPSMSPGRPCPLVTPRPYMSPGLHTPTCSQVFPTSERTATSNPVSDTPASQSQVFSNCTGHPKHQPIHLRAPPEQPTLLPHLASLPPHLQASCPVPAVPYKYILLSETMDIFCLAGSVQQTQQ